MRTALEFLGMFCVGWAASFVLLLAFKNEYPEQDAQIEKQIKDAFRRLTFRAGLIVAVVWLLYHWGPIFGD